LNLRLLDYESSALPLSYTGLEAIRELDSQVAVLVSASLETNTVAEAGFEPTISGL
jgi:hypothetical protein